MENIIEKNLIKHFNIDMGNAYLLTDTIVKNPYSMKLMGWEINFNKNYIVPNSIAININTFETIANFVKDVRKDMGDK